MALNGRQRMEADDSSAGGASRVRHPSGIGRTVWRGTRRRLLALALLGGLSPTGPPAAAAPGAQAATAGTLPQRLALAPYLSPAALLAAFRPHREQLQARLGEPVELYTARDFAALVDAMRRGDTDLALVPAHLGLVAIVDWGWAPMAGSVPGSPVLILVQPDGPVATPADLRGRGIGMLDPMSLVAAVAKSWLAELGLQPGVDVEVVVTASVNSALIGLARGELAAVALTATQLLGLPPSTPTSLRRLAELVHIPGPVIVARPGLPSTTLAAWRAALHAFEPDPNRPTTAANSRLTPLTPADLARVEPWAVVLRQELRGR